MCPRDPFHRFCYGKDKISSSNLVSVNIVGGGNWPCHDNFAEKHYQYTLPTHCLIARAFLCDGPYKLQCCIKYPCGAASSSLYLELEPGMNIIVNCEDNIIYHLELICCSAVSYTVNLQLHSHCSKNGYKLSDYPIPPYWTVLYTEPLPSLTLLSRIALGEQFVSQSLPFYGDFPNQARNIKYYFVEQGTRSNIIDC